MKKLSLADRPREKLLAHGVAGLGDNELMAIVIGSGTRRHDALALANAVLELAGGLHGTLRLSVDDLCALPGLGMARAAQLLAAVELGRRTLLYRAPERPQLGTPREVAALLLPEYGGRPTEHFGVVMVDTKHRVLRTLVVSQGGLDGVSVLPRDVYRHAAAAGAAAVVLFHNHPSGDPTPSGDDVALTSRFTAAGQLLGIPVLDHVVLGEGRYCSFKELGLL